MASAFECGCCKFGDGDAGGAWHHQHQVCVLREGHRLVGRPRSVRRPCRDDSAVEAGTVLLHHGADGVMADQGLDRRGSTQLQDLARRQRHRTAHVDPLGPQRTLAQPRAVTELLGFDLVDRRGLRLLGVDDVPRHDAIGSSSHRTCGEYAVPTSVKRGLDSHAAKVPEESGVDVVQHAEKRVADHMRDANLRMQFFVELLGEQTEHGDIRFGELIVPSQAFLRLTLNQQGYIATDHVLTQETP
mmetsp:Transcript_149253/g.379657  ORF Transcript_149253/g.379657 Transcript_149253/m.379657 type:complete len:244 (+) Transcript_149253:693-1424(+)